MQRRKPKARKPMSRNFYCYFGNLHFNGMLCDTCREGLHRRLPGFTHCEHGIPHVHGQALRSDGGLCPRCYDEREAREAAKRRAAAANRRAAEVPRPSAEEGATTSAAGVGIGAEDARNYNVLVARNSSEQVFPDSAGHL